MSMFVKANKRQLKARLALDGPTGSGKTWTALEWATVLGKRIAVIDTERGSASLYSHRLDFDVLELAPPYDPARCVEALRDAEANGYDVVIIDSLTHFWQGEGGTLDIKEAADKRIGGNQYAGWSVATPALRRLVDTMLGLDCHLIVTMRSKMDYLKQRAPDGSESYVRVGMAPIMRDGIEYEFTILGDMDLEHRIIISKSRCDVLADALVQPNRAKEAAETFLAWLDDGEPLAARDEIDALKARINLLPDEARVACKRHFVDNFGRPDILAASSLSSASAFVAEYEADAEWVAGQEAEAEDPAIEPPAA